MELIDQDKYDNDEVMEAEKLIHILAEEYRLELAKMTTAINKEIFTLIKLDIRKITKALGYDDIIFVLREFVEPNIDLKEKIAMYMDKLELLKRYCGNFASKYDDDQINCKSNLVEFELTRRFEDWQRMYQDIRSAIANALFAKDYSYLKPEILQLMDQ